MRKGRQLSEEEKALWEGFAKRIHLSRKDLKDITLRENLIVTQKRTIPINEKRIFLNADQSKRLSQTTSFIQHYKDLKRKQEERYHPLDHFSAVGSRPSGLDNSTWKKLQKGQIQPEQILDLHGYTAQRAFFLLEEFLFKSHRYHVRCVEIITGIGSSSKDGGILKRELPFWLNRPALKPLILATIYPTQWNGGAVRILLKRHR